MVSPCVPELSDKADVSASDSDDLNENGLQAEEEGVQLVVKKNTTSKVWKYFRLLLMKTALLVIAIHLKAGCVTKECQRSGPI